MITNGRHHPRLHGAGASVGTATKLDARLVESVTRLRSRERRRTADALARERRRIAADVHDLIMQDLAFALGNARMLADDPAQPPEATVVVAAGERALTAAREMVSCLMDGEDKPIAEALVSSVGMAARHVPLRCSTDGVPAGAEPDGPTLHTLVHVAREGVTNAVKHGAPSSIEVALEYAGEWRLRVHDDGHGFDSVAARSGFGLRSMSQQAEALGGALWVSSGSGLGTTIEAVLP